MAQIQFSLKKKIKIGRPEHLVHLSPPTPGNILFLPYSPPHPLKIDAICVSALIAISIVVKEELTNETVNYDTKTEAYVLNSARSVSY